MKSERIYWLDGFEGQCKGGLFSRSDICKTIIDTEKFKNVGEVVGIKVKPKENGRPDFTIEFIFTETKENI